MIAGLDTKIQEASLMEENGTVEESPMQKAFVTSTSTIQNQHQLSVMQNSTTKDQKGDDNTKEDEKRHQSFSLYSDKHKNQSFGDKTHGKGTIELNDEDVPSIEIVENEDYADIPKSVLERKSQEKQINEATTQAGEISLESFQKPNPPHLNSFQRKMKEYELQEKQRQLKEKSRIAMQQRKSKSVFDKRKNDKQLGLSSSLDPNRFQNEYGSLYDNANVENPYALALLNPLNASARNKQVSLVPDLQKDHKPIMDTFSGKFNKPLPLLHYKGSLKDIIRKNKNNKSKSLEMFQPSQSAFQAEEQIKTAYDYFGSPEKVEKFSEKPGSRKVDKEVMEDLKNAIPMQKAIEIAHERAEGYNSSLQDYWPATSQVYITGHKHNDSARDPQEAQIRYSVSRGFKNDTSLLDQTRMAITAQLERKITHLQKQHKFNLHQNQVSMMGKSSTQSKLMASDGFSCSQDSAFGFQASKVQPKSQLRQRIDRVRTEIHQKSLIDKEEKKQLALENNNDSQKEGKILDGLLEESIDIPAGYGKPKRPQTLTNQEDPPFSKAYETYKQRQKEKKQQEIDLQEGVKPKEQIMELKVQNDDPYHNNKNSNEEQSRVDRLRYFRIQKSGDITLATIMATPKSQYSQNDYFYLRMWLKLNVAYFMHFDNATLQSLVKCLQQVTFARDDLIIKKGDHADAMFIILQGEAGVYLDTKKFFENACVATLVSGQVFGERALTEKTPRNASVIAHEETICLKLKASDFMEQVFHMEFKQKMARLSFIQSLPFVQHWTPEKIQYLNSLIQQTNYSPGDQIYGIGHSPDVLYIIKEGCIEMITQIDLDNVNKFPLSNNSWEIKHTKLHLEFPVRKFYQGELFGHQELVELMRQKRFEAENPDIPKQPPLKRKCLTKANSHCEILFLNFRDLKMVFTEDQIEEFYQTQFIYDMEKAMDQTRKALYAQKFVNNSISQAAALNIEATDGDGTHMLSVAHRSLKAQKMGKWIEKGGLGVAQVQTNLPRLPEVEKIKILKVSVNREIEERDPNGLVSRRPYQKPEPVNNRSKSVLTKANTLPTKQNLNKDVPLNLLPRQSTLRVQKQETSDSMGANFSLAAKLQKSATIAPQRKSILVTDDQMKKEMDHVLANI